MPRGPVTLVLSLHRTYACRSTGRCCSSGWQIAVEPGAEAAIRQGLASGRLGLEATAGHGDELLPNREGLPAGARTILGRDERGRCVFLESRRGMLCAVHRQLGPGALPVACRQFPRLAVLEPRATRISLSHYCPTAAGLLFGPPGHLEISHLDAEAMGPGIEGLDCRGALPPLLRPGALLSWDAHAAWCMHEIATLARRDLTPEGALRRLEADADAVRGWRVGENLEDRISELRSRAAPDPTPRTSRDERRDAALRQLAASAAARPLEDLGDPVPAAADERWVAPAWDARGDVISRYLAARAHGSWVAQQGRGLRSRVRALEVALAVLRGQAARLCAGAGRRLDDALLLEAIRASDLLLVHLTDPAAFAERCSTSEDEPRG